MITIRKKSPPAKPRSSPDPDHHEFLKRLMEEVENTFSASAWNFCETVEAVIEDGFHAMEGFTTAREWIIDRFGEELWPMIRSHFEEMQKRRREERFERSQALPQPSPSPADEEWIATRPTRKRKKEVVPAQEDRMCSAKLVGRHPSTRGDKILWTFSLGDAIGGYAHLFTSSTITSPRNGTAVLLEAIHGKPFLEIIAERDEIPEPNLPDFNQRSIEVTATAYHSTEKTKPGVPSNEMNGAHWMISRLLVDGKEVWTRRVGRGEVRPS